MAKRKESGELNIVVRILIRLAIVLFILFCVISIVSTQSQIAVKKKRVAELRESVSAMTDKNEELEALIESGDMGRYMESVAMGHPYDYAYPDERRYFDRSRDN